MNCAAQSEDFRPLVPCMSVRERQRTALRLFAGRGKRFSVKELSLGSGVKEKRLEAAMRPIDADDYRPLNHEELASVAKFLAGEGYGAAFVSTYLELSDLGAFELGAQPPLPRVLASADQPETPDDERKRLVRRLAELEGL